MQKLTYPNLATVKYYIPGNAGVTFLTITNNNINISTKKLLET